MAKLNYNVNPAIFQSSRGYKATKLREIIDEFRLSEKRFAEIVLEPGEYKSAEVARNAYNKSAKTMRAPVLFKVMDNKLYILSSIWFEGVRKSGEA